MKVIICHILDDFNNKRTYYYYAENDADAERILPLINDSCVVGHEIHELRKV